MRLHVGLGFYNGPSTPSSGGGGGAFTPASLPGLILWVENDPATMFTDAGVTPVSADGQAVYQWNDKSGLGHHLTQPTLGNRPLYQSGSGHPYLSVDGTDDWMATAGLSATDGSGLLWMAWAGQIDNTTSSKFFASASGAGNVFYCRQSDGTAVATSWLNTGSGAATDLGGAISASTPVVVIATVTATETEIFVNNATDGPTSNSAGTLQTTAASIYLCSLAGGGSFMQGRAKALVWGTGTLSSSDRASLNTYLAAL